MIINRYNYEEYFLLYTDDELGEAERKAVERFVEENPDLKNELLGFQDAVLHADEEVRFPGKKELLSSNASLSVINGDNYTEYFLLYSDNELNNEEKAQVEQYVYHHPKLQEEFELLLRIKMEADRTIIFEHKELLMRRTEKARVIVGWWKITASVAAALIFIIFGYLKYTGENETGEGSLLSQETKTGTDSQQKRRPLITIENNPDGRTSKTGEEVQKTVTDKTEAVEKPVVSEAVAMVKKKRTDLQPDQQKPYQASVSETMQTAEPKELQTAELPEVVENTVAISVGTVQTLHQENLRLNAPTFVTESSVDAEESQFSIAGIPVTSKSKVGNFISRTSRFINKTKKDISSRSGLAIGKFEIAIR